VPVYQTPKQQQQQLEKTAKVRVGTGNKRGIPRKTWPNGARPFLIAVKRQLLRFELCNFYLFMQICFFPLSLSLCRLCREKDKRAGNIAATIFVAKLAKVPQTLTV